MEKIPLLTGFPGGNIEQWITNLQFRTPRIANLLLKTILPLISATLISLLGDSSKFKKKEGSITTVKSKIVQAFTIQLTYSVPGFIGFSGSEDAIVRDKLFILRNLKKITGISWSEDSIKILPQNGTVIISFIVPVGRAF